ncbi:MAG: hypothetical protein P1T08_17405, partial [Acidimicrobiia bacterium]|nr:hypothetical protein [Acidimicrobiia bacterium]
MRVRTNRSGPTNGLILAAAVLVLSTLISARPALADHCSGDGQIDDRGGDVVGECHGIVPGEPETYTMNELWDYYCADAGPFREGDEVGFYEVGPVEPDEIELFGLDPTGVYVWYDVICWRDGRGDIEVQIIVEVTPGVPPEVIRDIAAARLEPPPPVPATSPPLANETFVQVPTWLWLDPGYWSPLEASETRGAVTVTVLATPTRATWAMGDGRETTCFGPGVAWTQGAAEDA